MYLKAPGEVSNPHGLHESLKVLTLGQLELAAHLKEPCHSHPQLITFLGHVRMQERVGLRKSPLKPGFFSLLPDQSLL